MAESGEPIQQTVHFGRSISGSEVVRAVRDACNARDQDKPVRGGQDFYSDRPVRLGDPGRIGQTSLDPARNLLVKPVGPDELFRPESSYDSAVVVQHRLPGTQWAVHVSQDQEIAAVADFAERLSRHLPAEQQADAGPAYDPAYPSPTGAVASRPDARPAASAWRKDSPGAESRGY
ncbi:hypothetical protein [Kribbella sp. C-35]|uniref:hypothetical protein n=1 Tax=Kribbella sp. C-35 TaxID=2789276 RepID=UPI00397DA3C1